MKLDLLHGPLALALLSPLHPLLLVLLLLLLLLLLLQVNLLPLVSFLSAQLAAAASTWFQPLAEQLQVLTFLRT
jgi:hypothetical protein